MAKFIFGIILISLMAALVDTTVTMVTNSEGFGFLMGCLCAFTGGIALAKDQRKVDNRDGQE